MLTLTQFVISFYELLLPFWSFVGELEADVLVWLLCSVASLLLVAERCCFSVCLCYFENQVALNSAS